jgi:creatinine amidohydrolase
LSNPRLTPLACLLTAMLASLTAPVSQADENTRAVEPAPNPQFSDNALKSKLTMARPITEGNSLWLEELTWMEIRDLIAGGTNTVIIPTGGIEENGPFLSTGKHNVILEATCPAIAKKLGNTLCAPIVKFVPEGDISPPSGAMLFPGTISLKKATYEALLDDIASSLQQAGFTHIVMIGDSGGNQSGMDNVVQALNQRWRMTNAQAHYIGEFYDPGWEATENYTRAELGVSETQKDGHHDDIWVTAMMMVTDPDQVRHRQRLVAGLASINGVSIESVDDSVNLGKAMIEFRAELTADVIRRRIEPEAN